MKDLKRRKIYVLLKTIIKISALLVWFQIGLITLHDKYPNFDYQKKKTCKVVKCGKIVHGCTNSQMYNNRTVFYEHWQQTKICISFLLLFFFFIFMDINMVLSVILYWEHRRKIGAALIIALYMLKLDLALLICSMLIMGYCDQTMKPMLQRIAAIFWSLLNLWCFFFFFFSSICIILWEQLFFFVLKQQQKK